MKYKKDNGNGVKRRLPLPNINMVDLFFEKSHSELDTIHNQMNEWLQNTEPVDLFENDDDEEERKHVSISSLVEKALNRPIEDEITIKSSTSCSQCYPLTNETQPLEETLRSCVSQSKSSDTIVDSSENSNKSNRPSGWRRRGWFTGFPSLPRPPPPVPPSSPSPWSKWRQYLALRQEVVGDPDEQPCESETPNRHTPDLPSSRTSFSPSSSLSLPSIPPPEPVSLPRTSPKSIQNESLPPTRTQRTPFLTSPPTLRKQSRPQPSPPLPPHLLSLPTSPPPPPRLPPLQHPHPILMRRLFPKRPKQRSLVCHYTPLRLSNSLGSPPAAPKKPTVPARSTPVLPPPPPRLLQQIPIPLPDLEFRTTRTSSRKRTKRPPPKLNLLLRASPKVPQKPMARGASAYLKPRCRQWNLDGDPEPNSRESAQRRSTSNNVLFRTRSTIGDERQVDRKPNETRRSAQGVKARNRSTGSFLRSEVLSPWNKSVTIEPQSKKDALGKEYLSLRKMLSHNKSSLQSNACEEIRKEQRSASNKPKSGHPLHHLVIPGHMSPTAGRSSAVGHHTSIPLEGRKTARKRVRPLTPTPNLCLTQASKVPLDPFASTKLGTEGTTRKELMNTMKQEIFGNRTAVTSAQIRRPVITFPPELKNKIVNGINVDSLRIIRNFRNSLVL